MILHTYKKRNISQNLGQFLSLLWRECGRGFRKAVCFHNNTLRTHLDCWLGQGSLERVKGALGGEGWDDLVKQGAYLGK